MAWEIIASKRSKQFHTLFQENVPRHRLTIISFKLSKWRMNPQMKTKILKIDYRTVMCFSQHKPRIKLKQQLERRNLKIRMWRGMKKEGPLDELQLEHLTDSYSTWLRVILKKYKSLHEGTLGEVFATEDYIDLKNGSKNIRQLPYRAVPGSKEVVK